MTGRNALTLALSLALAACGGGGEPKGQVLATVDGEEITATDLRAELNGATAGSPEQQKMMERMALQNIVNRTILAQAAKKEGLDKTPEYAVMARKAEQMALIEMLNDKSRKAMPQPSADEVNNFVSSNPVMFEQRRTFVVDQIVVPRADQALATALQPVKTLAEARAVLAQRKVPSSEAVGVIDALTIPPEAAKQIAALPPGEVFVIPSGGGMRINQVRSSQTNPITGEQAQAIAREMLTRQRLQGQLQNQAGSLIKAGQANVKYNAEYAPPKEATGAAGAQGAPAAGASATAATGN